MTYLPPLDIILRMKPGLSRVILIAWGGFVMSREKKQTNRNMIGSLLIILMMFSLLSAGCLGKILKKPAPKKEPPPPKIGVLMATMKGDGYEIIKKEMDKSKKKEKVDLQWEDAKNDPQTQQKQVEKLLKQKVKVMVLDLVNPSLGGALVPKIAEKKIPVLALDKIPEGTEVAGVVLPDYLRAGELQGQYVAKSVPSGKVLLLMGRAESQLGKALYQGFIRGLQAETGVATGLVVQKQELSDMVTDSEVESKVKEALLAHPDAAAVVSQEPRQTLALVKFLTTEENKAKAEKLITVGLGADKTSAVALAAGKHDAEVDTRPELMAYYALKAAKQLADGQKLELAQNIKNGNVDVQARVIPVRLISLENIWLLQDRWGDLKKEVEKLEKKEKSSKGGTSGAKSGSSGTSDKGGSGGSSGSNGTDGKGSSSSKSDGSSGQKGKKTTLIVKTKEGKTMEIEVDGEIQEIKTQDKKEESSKGSGKGSDKGNSNK